MKLIMELYEISTILEASQLEIKALRKLRSEPLKRALQEAIAW